MVNRLWFSVIALLFAALLASCDDPSAPIEDPSRTVDSSSIRITSISDTICRHYDTVSIKGYGFGNDSTKLLLYIGFREIPLRSVSDTELTIIIPRIFVGDSGRVRLYRGDTLAAGDFRISIISVDERVRFWQVQTVQWIYVYPMEPFALPASDMHGLPREIDLRLGAKKLIVDSLSPHSIWARVPEGTGSDSVFITFNGERRKIGYLKVLSRNDDLLHASNLRVLEFSHHGFEGKTQLLRINANGDTIRGIETFFNGGATYDGRRGSGQAIKIIGDSILFSGSFTSDSFVISAEFRFKQEKPACTVSGVLRYTVKKKEGLTPYYYTYEVNVAGLPYRRAYWGQSYAVIEGESARNVVKSVRSTMHRFVDGLEEFRVSESEPGVGKVSLSIAF